LLVGFSFFFEAFYSHLGTYFDGFDFPLNSVSEDIVIEEELNC
jgi:hypothetical protein